ncbi:MAG: YihY/virulence factor BrkB family protein [Ilumatobacteraceae bacterium]
MAWTDHHTITAIRRRSRVMDVVVETLAGFSAHKTGRNGAVLTYYGFLTLFPLFLAATTILGFVLDNRPDLYDDLVGSAVAQIPFIGEQISSRSIDGSWWALIIGLVAALWGSTKAFVGLQVAYDDVWETPQEDRSNFVTQRVRALIGLAVIGGSQIATVALAALVSQASLPRLGQILIVLGGLAINVVVLATMYRFLTSAEASWEAVWPGAAFAGALYTAIQLAGTALIDRLTKSDTYGDMSTVLALLSWLSLHALINLIGAEINSALRRLRIGRDAATTLDSPMAAHAPLSDA